MTRISDCLRSPYRSVRAIDATEGPWPGMLTCLPSGERSVFVDCESVGADWPGWDCRPDGHILTARDVLRRADGHDILMDVCVGTLSTFIAQRASERSPLSRGEAVTVGISILRGCAELHEVPEATGEWWLTDHGRPVFAVGVGGGTVRDTSAAIIAEISRGSALPPGWARAFDVLSSARAINGDYADAEAMLVSVAAPAPLLAAGGPHSTSPSIGGLPESATVQVPHQRTAPLWHSLSRHVDADFSDFVARAAAELRQRLNGARRRRSAPLVVGAAAATLVIALGMWWPADDSTDAPASEQAGPAPATTQRSTGEAASPTARPSSAATPATEIDEDPPGGSDHAAVAGSLLDSLRACADDGACQAQYASSPTDTWSAGAAGVAADRRVITLVDDFGGIAVLRVEATSGGQAPKIVVIGRQDDRWLLRDVSDVEQQPS